MASSENETSVVVVVAAGTQETPKPSKPIHTIILDTSPILLNTPSISTLLANSHALVTTSAVIAEVRGEEARSRLETLYMPFLTVRQPKAESVKLIKDFARKTGDFAVLSPTDFEVLALAYDLECERNGGDWRLRSTPGQKRVNGSPPQKLAEGEVEKEEQTKRAEREARFEEESAKTEKEDMKPAPIAPWASFSAKGGNQVQKGDVGASAMASVTDQLNSTSISDEQQPQSLPTNEPVESVPQEGKRQETEEDGQMSETPVVEVVDVGSEPASDPDSDSEGWITPSNIKRHQARDDAASKSTQSEGKTLQVATMTDDFAMQNVLLQMNLNLLSSKTCRRVAHIKQMIFRCHACFATTKDMSKQFCARCGKPTLTRVTCTTNDKGEVKLHLKSNYQWNNRGNVFSVPKPTGGTANQKWQGPRQGGGKAGWGNDLLLAEDQKEYKRAQTGSRSNRAKDLMDEDYLPGILTGDRSREGGRIKVGAGRNVNSRKR